LKIFTEGNNLIDQDVDSTSLNALLTDKTPSTTNKLNYKRALFIHVSIKVLTLSKLSFKQFAEMK
jgi:hypothetical protein